MQFASIYAMEPNAVFDNCLPVDFLPISQQFSPCFVSAPENPGSFRLPEVNSSLIYSHGIQLFIFKLLYSLKKN